MKVSSNIPKCCSAVLSFLLANVTFAAEPIESPSSPAAQHFDNQVAPIFASHCLECHRGPTPKGKLDLSQRATAFRGGESGAAIVARNLDESLVWERIEADEMPPKHPLPAAEKKLLREWILSGATWGSNPIDPFRFSTNKRAGYDWWSLQPLVKVKLPHTADAPRGWGKHPIDRIIYARLKEKGLAPSPRADPRTLVRRIYIDLIGLPAPGSVIDKFDKDPSAKAWAQLVDELLASQHYGERWARHWLDVVRFGESHGYEYNQPREAAWHYRDWVIRAFNNDLPYDQFTRMQLAGDVIKPKTLEGAAAVGFLVAGTHNTVLGASPAMKLAGRHEELEEMAGTVAQTFLGLTVNCARCHDHKFDPIAMREYYSFIAALDGVKHGEIKVRTQNDLTARREQLHRQRDDLHNRLIEMVPARNGLTSTTANQVRLKNPIDANDKGKSYRVSLKIAPSVWASAAQATSDRDGITVLILREDGSVLASHSSRPGAWDRGRNATEYQLHTFDYKGDGNGRIQIHIRPFPVHSNRFGGAVDDLVVVDAASRRAVFEESFDGLQRPHAPGSQTDTHKAVFYGAMSDRWTHSGTNSIHAVEHADGNLALQLFSGNGGRLVVKAESDQEKKLQAEIASLDRQIRSISSAGTTSVFSVESKNPGVMRLLLRGDVTRPSDDVAPGGMKAIGSVSPSFGIDKNATDAQRRQRLAEWISNRENGPLHRVAVNRVWHYHFGQGIVESPSDLGFNGGRPSHPALLEWLAVWFRENDYSVKKLHKLIATSATYQQSSRSSPAAANIDHGNRLLWRQNARRVEAEVLRDSILDIAGELNREQFGPPFRDVRIVHVAPTNYYLPIDPVGKQFNRRTIYRWHVRGQRSALLDSFDCPDPSAKTPIRSVTTTPTQALSQWNDSFILRMSDKLADRVQRESGDEVASQVDRTWRLVLGRDPDVNERAKSLRLAKNHGLALLCRVLLNSNEFVLID
jgi:hypothetical protein